MIPIKDLVVLEQKVLNILGFSLNISTDQFYQWTEQCNTIYDMPYISLDQLNLFDLHMTNTTIGYVTLLPVLLNDIYNNSVIFNSTSSSMCNNNDFLLLNNDNIMYTPPTVPTQFDYQLLYQQLLMPPPAMEHMWYSTQTPIFL